MIDITPEAAHILQKLKLKYGSLLFHISGGCCDGTGPVCLPVDDFMINETDTLIGKVLDCEVYISTDSISIFQRSTFIIDVAKGIGSSFSVEIPEGYRFKLHSNICIINK